MGPSSPGRWHIVAAASQSLTSRSSADWTAHAEMAAGAVRDAGNSIDLNRAPRDHDDAVLDACAGMIQHLGILVVIVGDDESWPDGALDWLRTRQCQVIVRRVRGSPSS